MKDHYATLGVSRSAEDVVIRAAYRALAQAHHPDKTSAKDRAAANGRMSEINEAYETLGDQERRRTYDQLLGTARDAPDIRGRVRSPWGWTRGRIAAVQAVIVCASVVIASAASIERKSFLRWGWQLVISGGSNNSHYDKNWVMLLVIIGLGVAAAWQFGRSARSKFKNSGRTNP